MLSGTAELKELVQIMKELFKEGKTVKLTAQGSSMMPLLRSGIDAVELAECSEPEKLKKRDVPLYERSDGKFVLHRIVKVHDDCFDMCGDNQITVERGVKKSAVAAKAVGFYSRGKYYPADGFLQRTYAFLWCAVLPHRFRIYRVLRVFRKRK